MVFVLVSAAELKKIHTWVGNLQIEKHRMEQGTKSKKKGKGKAKLKLDDDTVSFFVTSLLCGPLAIL